MLRSIKKLDKAISNKIAAGEVVERPASVIKELLENSIDAGATAITIEVQDAGKSLIRVSDNGHGINKEEISLAFERHATSKIYTDDDIYNIKSLGFRGEALASISSVSKVEIVTRQKDAEHGIRAELLNGTIVHSTNVGAQVGTTIMVKDLLYNTPARLKFLKSNATELNHINAIVNNLAISHPEIGFKYISNDRNVFSTKGDGNLLNVIYTIHGKDIARNLMPVNASFKDVSITGFVSKIQNTRGNRQLEATFVNNRFVKTRVFTQAIESAYKTLIPSGRFPICFLYLNVSPKAVDVNIHPAKTEIKFRDEVTIKNFIHETVNDALISNNIVPSITLKESKKVETNINNIVDPQKNEAKEGLAQNTSKAEVTKPNIDHVGDQIALALHKRKENFIDITSINEDITKEDIEKVNKVNESIRTYSNLSKPITPTYSTSNISVNNPSNSTYDQFSKNDDTFDIPTQTKSVVEDKPEKKINTILDNLKVIGQLFTTYILCEYDNKLYVIDQHAAHERVMYERFLESYRNSDIVSQILLEPISIELSYQDKKLVMDNIVIFRKLGYKIEDFGYNTIILREVPILFKTPVARSFFNEILDKIEDMSSAYDQRIEKVISMSCRKAIKAHDSLKTIEIDKLLKELRTIENPFTCPHGRPTIISITKSELEKKFFRT